jgi:hypothetical protein
MAKLNNASCRVVAAIVATLFATSTAAQRLSWQFEQFFTNADKTIQFIVMRESSNQNDQDGVRNSTVQSIISDPEHLHYPGVPLDLVLPDNLPSTSTAGRRFLIATQGFAKLAIVTPDYIIDDGFIPFVLGQFSFYKNFSTVYDTVLYPSLPNDGISSLYRDGSIKQAVATNFAGQSQTVSGLPPPTQTAQAVEYYYAAWDYYFRTSFADEIALLDGGGFNGNWQRSGYTIKVWPQATSSSSPTCRFFSTSFSPKSSHFYTPFAAECGTVKQNNDWQFESVAFHLQLADASGNCPSATTLLYRLYNNGMGGAPNHRYTTSQTIFKQMVAAGWVFEGDSVTKAFACVPQ